MINPLDRLPEFLADKPIAIKVLMPVVWRRGLRSQPIANRPIAGQHRNVIH